MKMNDICLLPENEPETRHGKVCTLLAESGIDMALIADNATIYYPLDEFLTVLWLSMPEVRRKRSISYAVLLDFPENVFIISANRKIFLH